MVIIPHKRFEKSFDKLDVKIKKKFFERLRIFKINKSDLILNNHALSGKLKGTRSINITGDIRVQYIEFKGAIILLNIGSHSDLYE